MLYFSEKNIRGNHAGTKARNDVEKILQNYGCKPLNSKKYILTSDSSDSIHSNVTNRLMLSRFFLELIKFKNEIVFVQYPMLAFDKETEYLTRIAKSNKLVLLVHDIHGLKRQNQEEITKEIAKLNLASGVIVHNRFMEDKLKKHGLTVPCIYKLDIFDYLYDGEIVSDRKKECGLAFAGNLEKSEFFRSFAEANPDIILHLYGQKFDDSLEEFQNIKYMGNYKPDEIPGKINGKYGLVWDGESITTCSGIFGEYTRYNNPHKLSLYLTAGMPVIVWKDAAIAEFVMNHRVGVCVESLESLEKVINAVSDEEYTMMLNNVTELRKRLLSGDNLKMVLKKIEIDFEE